MLPLLGLALPLIKTVIGSFTKGFEHKRKLKEERQRGEIEWAKHMAQASGKSWKDEYLTLVWTLPIVLGMLGYTEPLANLLIILKEIPPWYTYLLLVITLASFGLSATGRWKEATSRQLYVKEKMNGKTREDQSAHYLANQKPKRELHVMDHKETSD